MNTDPSLATASGDPSEVETPEYLEHVGWRRLTGNISTTSTYAGEVESREIMQDRDGGLWLVSDWRVHRHGRFPHRAARRNITREQACSLIVTLCIPEEFREDFRASAASDAGGGE